MVHIKLIIFYPYFLNVLPKPQEHGYLPEQMASRHKNHKVIMLVTLFIFF
jgi:hypothetical protein